MSELRDQALSVIAEARVMTVATTGPEGPWAAPVFYAPDGFQLTFLSSPRSRHATDLAADPRCAVALFPEPGSWAEIRGVQMAGRVDLLEGGVKAAAMARYVRRFPFVDPSAAPVAIRAALERVRWYRFSPEEVFLVDNRRGFGRIPVPL